MNKSALKNFAANARKELIEKVKAKAFKIGITEENIKKAQFESSDAIYIDGKQLSATEKKQREKLISRIKEIGYKQVIEEVSYTWFNRFTALRFMEINNYLPSKVRVLSSSNSNSSEPDIIKEALTVDLDIDKELVYNLKLNNEIEELFKYLVIKQCNSLNKILPFMFETIDDYKEILFPEGLLAKDSFLREMTNVTSIPELDWEKVEVIGWLYQYYISEEKVRIFKEKAKFEAEEIPYATQLFTPDWIVQYMVQNSLGRYWIEAHSEHKNLKDNWEFYLEDPNRESDLEKKLASYINKSLNVEEIKCFDPAMGSGHILVYMFDVLYEIYSKCGYMEREIPKLIIENNLFGLDIDDRAYQLACFSVVMKAMEYNKRFFRSIENEGLKLNLASVQESNSLTNEDIAFIAGGNIGETFDLTKEFIELFKEAKTLGSLIKLNVYPRELLENRLEIIKEQPVDDLLMISTREKSIELLSQLIKQANIMYKQYDILITNPPYMGLKHMNTVLATYLSKHYPHSKFDLFASFMEIDQYLKEHSFYASVNQHSWMFLSSFEKLRKKVIGEKLVDSMLHLGPRAFEEIGGEVVQSTAFVLRNSIISNRESIYLRLIDEKTSKGKRDRTLEAVQNPNVSYRYLFNQTKFTDIPGSPLAYWVTEGFAKSFSEKKISECYEVKSGIRTGKDPTHLRLWFEVDILKVKFDCKEAKEMTSYTWFPINKGGDYRVYYGNNSYIVNLKNDGENIKKISNDYRLRDKKHYFKEGITWSRVSSADIAFRENKSGTLFGDAGPLIIIENKEERLYVLGLLTSKVANEILNFINPTLNYQKRDIESLPLIISNDDPEKICNIVDENVEISRQDWDSSETSYDFLYHPMIKYIKELNSLRDIYEKYSFDVTYQRARFKQNSQEINKYFIELYGLEKELNFEVTDNDIAILKPNMEQDIKSFISYAIGCLFGRYSLDEVGIVYAGGDFKTSHYKAFTPDKDNILPILSGTFSEDEIVSRFVEFVRVTFGEEWLEENLRFVANAVGHKSGETVREALRRYFLNDFYKDHVRTYTKRPIYWLFSSGKEKAFNCLIYMHRYDKSTLSRIRTDYLHELQIRMEAEKKSLLDVINGDGTTKEIANAKKELKSLDLKIEELRSYDEKLHHMADMQIEIDLDDGVAVNYRMFDGLLAPIK